MYIILLGAPGAGKGTQAVMLAEKLNMVQVASGDLFRRALRDETELGKKAKTFMDKGQLVPDEITIQMVLDRLEAPDCKNGALLDGFPRNIGQAEALDKAMEKQSKAIDKVVYIKVSEGELLKRLSGRWICRDCQAPAERENISDCGYGPAARRDNAIVRTRVRLPVPAPVGYDATWKHSRFGTGMSQARILRAGNLKICGECRGNYMDSEVSG